MGRNRRKSRRIGRGRRVRGESEGERVGGDKHTRESSPDRRRARERERESGEGGTLIETGFVNTIDRRRPSDPGRRGSRRPPKSP